MNKFLIFLLILFTSPGWAQTNAPKPVASTNKFKPYVPPPAAVKVGEPKQIRITSVDGVLATYFKCQTSAGTIYLAGLPANVKAEFDTVARLEKFVASEQEYAKREAKRIRDAENRIPANYDYDSPAAAYSAQLSKESSVLYNRVEDARETAKELKQARERVAAVSTVHARDTGRLYGTVPIWQVVPK